MFFFNKNKEPIFLRESNNTTKQIQKLKELEPLLNAEGQAIIKKDIRFLQYGLEGEERIAFELKNSHMPMIVLHDIYLDDGTLSAQIDYLVFTRKLCFVIECKNLYGDIEINNSGDFIRTITYNGKKFKEGIYSPITQNQRHLELMKKMKTEKRNILSRTLTSKYFEEYNIPIVVLANPKTILNAKFASRAIKQKVIRADQLVKYIKDMNAQSKVAADSEEYTMQWAQSYLNLHKEIDKDYTAKYEKYKVTQNMIDASSETSTKKEVTESLVVNEIPIEETDLFKELKSYRLNKSRLESIKPYLIYNDNQLKALINRKPRTVNELCEVNGFNVEKANKYGEDIISILMKY